MRLKDPGLFGLRESGLLKLGRGRSLGEKMRSEPGWHPGPSPSQPLGHSGPRSRSGETRGRDSVREAPDSGMALGIQREREG